MAWITGDITETNVVSRGEKRVEIVSPFVLTASGEPEVLSEKWSTIFNKAKETIVIYRVIRENQLAIIYVMAVYLYNGDYIVEFGDGSIFKTDSADGYPVFDGGLS